MSASDEGTARRLPAGAHGIPAEVVARNQRERLVAAMAETCAEKGYAETSIADLTRRAGISSATFYQLFPGKRDCMLAAHRELSERLLEEVDEACKMAGAGKQKLRMSVRTTLELLAADPPSARLLAVEVLAVGPEGMERQATTIDGLASRLGVDWAMVAAMSMLVARLVMVGEAERLPGLEDELVALALDNGIKDK